MLKKRIDAFKHAFSGLRCFFSEGVHARLHAVAGLIVLGLGFFFGVSQTEWMFLLACIGAVFSAEALNSALEYLCDAVHPKKNELIKKAKDVAAAAVLFSAIISVIIALIIFIPKF